MYNFIPQQKKIRKTWRSSRAKRNEDETEQSRGSFLLALILLLQTQFVSWARAHTPRHDCAGKRPLLVLLTHTKPSRCVKRRKKLSRRFLPIALRLFFSPRLRFAEEKAERKKQLISLLRTFNTAASRRRTTAREKGKPGARASWKDGEDKRKV